MRVIKLSLVVLVLRLIPTAFASEMGESRVSLGSSGWQFRERWSLSAVRSEERALVSESTRADVSGALEFSRHFDNELHIHLVPAFRFVTGRDQDVFSERLPKDKIYAEEAKVRWTPVAWGALEGGALNQAHIRNDLLVEDRPFPAARVELGQGDLKASLQWAIPSSYTLEAQATDNEPLPQLQTYSLMWDRSVSDSFVLEAGATYFAFSDLPQIVAVTSRRLGNTAHLFSSTTGQFVYGYKGVAAQLGARAQLGAWGLRWRGEGIRNTEAPSSLGIGFVSAVQVTRPLSARQDGGLELAYYRVRPDTAPALYTDPVTSNNRIGAGGSLFVNHRAWGLQFRASYFQDTPYYRKDEMGDRNLFLISVGNFRDDKTSLF